MANTNNPTISVVVQTRETPLMILKRCIQSLREQTYPDIEILLLDSNDAGSQYKDAIHGEKDFFSDIIFIEVPETGEYVEGKNRALNIFHGEYITFISAQDTMPPMRLEEIMKIFRHNYSYNAIYTDMAIQQNNMLEISEYGRTYRHLEYLAQVIFHRDCFQWISGFDADLVAHCDDEIRIQLNSAKLTHYISSPETVISVCPACYNGFTPLQSAIGYRQLGVKYRTVFRKHKRDKKELYDKIATEYKKAGVLHRCIQFRAKSMFTHVKKGEKASILRSNIKNLR